MSRNIHPEPAGFCTFFLFFLDPAHVNFAHHRVQGNRASGSPLDIEIDKEAAPGV